MKKIIFLFAIVLFFIPEQPVFAAPIVYAIENDAVIYTNRATEVWPIASLTKLMSAIILNDLNLDWDTPIALTRKDERGGARLRVSVGQKYRRIDLLHASLMGSANNATYALARTSGLTMEQFVAQMNAKAAMLGMTSAHFVDPTGIEIENTASAEDVARLIGAAQQYPLIQSIGLKKAYTLYSVARRPQPHTIRTTNKILRDGESVELGKTGYLVESQYNFAMINKSASGGQRTVVVLGASSFPASFQIARKYANLAHNE